LEVLTIELPRGGWNGVYWWALLQEICSLWRPHTHLLWLQKVKHFIGSKWFVEHTSLRLFSVASSSKQI